MIAFFNKVIRKAFNQLRDNSAKTSLVTCVTRIIASFSKKLGEWWGKIFSPLSIGCRKIAFTLAEVLITLAIIGVVAALTMPALIQNYQKHVWVNQLKKSYSTWSQVFQQILAEDGVEKLSDTKAFSNPKIAGCSIIEHNEPECKKTFNELSKFIKLNTLKANYNSNSLNIDDESTMLHDTTLLALNDGSALSDLSLYTDYYVIDDRCDKIKNLGGTYCNRFGGIVIDVNGLKGPNITGRDVFRFDISYNGILYPYGGKDYALFYSQTPLETNEYYWKNQNDEFSNCSTTTYSIGYGCTGRIIDNGWKMDY